MGDDTGAASMIPKHGVSKRRKTIHGAGDWLKKNQLFSQLQTPEKEIKYSTKTEGKEKRTATTRRTLRLVFFSPSNRRRGIRSTHSRQGIAVGF